MLLCATSVFSVTLWLMNWEQQHTTETQRTQRLHRGLGLADTEDVMLAADDEHVAADCGSGDHDFADFVSGQ